MRQYWIMKQLNEREKQIELVARFLMDEYNLHDWKLQFRLMRRCLGKTFSLSKRIKLSTYFINKYPLDRMLNTILHEIAHALDKSNETSHGPTWKRIANEIGAIPRASMSAEKFKAEKEKLS